MNESPLPLPAGQDRSDPSFFLDSLLEFITSHQLFQTLVGGVHILEFFTHKPDLYGEVLPQEWRTWFADRSMADTLDLLLREDISSLQTAESWRDGPVPPQSLLEYISLVRQFSLDRSVRRDISAEKIPKPISVGMSPKKLHEVTAFRSYIFNLVQSIAETTGKEITHVVDLGSGQNYLGRSLASEPMNLRVVAVEDKLLNIDGARWMDVAAKLTTREEVLADKNGTANGEMTGKPYFSTAGKGSIQYLQHRISPSSLTSLISEIFPPHPPNVLLISLHSCGNLIHYGLETLSHPQVAAIALVGCCYNLLTSSVSDPKLGFKPPFLRTNHPRLVANAIAPADDSGFPLSQKLRNYVPQETDGDASAEKTPGIRINITALMMACQAPANWTRETSEAFFTRHFFRALLQRIFREKGILKPQEGQREAQAIIIGSLSPKCYASFTSYTRAALKKILSERSASSTPLSPPLRAALEDLRDTITDEELQSFYVTWEPRRHDLSIVWALMAFSAQVIESVIVADRWQYLKETFPSGQAWAEAAWEYSISPRNLVIVGVKGEC